MKNSIRSGWNRWVANIANEHDSNITSNSLFLHKIFRLEKTDLSFRGEIRDGVFENDIANPVDCNSAKQTPSVYSRFGKILSQIGE
jgi:hypothetical protein